MRNKEFYANRLRLLFGKEKRISYLSIVTYGLNEIENRNYRKAYTLFLLGYRLFGNKPDILNGLAIALRELGRLHYAKKILNYAVNQHPQNALLLSNLATVYFEDCDYDKAIYYYTQALQLNPMDLDTHINLIYVYYERGDIYMAYITCLDVLKKSPYNQEALQLCNEIIIHMGLSLV